MAILKRYMQLFLNRFGYSIKKLRTNDCRRTLEESIYHLKIIGFKPKTIIDVGVAKGTHELYNFYPNSYYLLIEPVQEFYQDIQTLLKFIDGQLIEAAAGAKQGRMEINVHDNHLSGSSLYHEAMGAEADGQQRVVDLVTIDSLIEDNKIQPPYLLKVDVQGAELDVLEGAQKCLKDAEVIILEVSMFTFMKNAPDFTDVIIYMKSLGFVAYDILLGWNRPLDNALGQIDIVFVKKNGMFRENQTYATIDQYRQTLNVS